MSVATMTDRQLSGRHSQREPDVAANDFEAIYDAYHGRIFGLAYRMMGNADEALDVTQDAFISAYQHFDKLQPRRAPGAPEKVHLSAWLHRIAANKCIDALRQRNRRLGVDWETFAATAPASTDAEAYPEAYALARERGAQIQQILDQMSPNYRLALLLHEYQELSVREVAQSMGRTESAVKSLLFRAREQFRALSELEAGLRQAA